MNRMKYSRNHHHDLLARPPCGAREEVHGWGAIIVDPVAQLRELADLRRRGLLTEDQFEGQKARVLGS